MAVRSTTESAVSRDPDGEHDRDHRVPERSAQRCSQIGIAATAGLVVAVPHSAAQTCSPVCQNLDESEAELPTSDVWRLASGVFRLPSS